LERQWNIGFVPGGPQQYRANNHSESDQSQCGYHDPGGHRTQWGWAGVGMRV